MRKIKTTQQLIQEFISFWGDKFDYSLVNYISPTQKVKIICPLHGEFELYARKHATGTGCYKCGRLSTSLKLKTKLKKNTNDFIRKATGVHGNRYDYSKSIYTHSHNPLIIICKIHGEFTQIASYHLQGSGCKSCQYMDKENNYRQFKDLTDLESFLKNKTNNKITISKIDKLTFTSKVTLCCETHGEFASSINSIVKSKFICKPCGSLNVSETKRKTTEQFINKCKEVHGDLYDYSKTIYNQAHKRATFICQKHGEFQQYVGAHLNGSGCPRCRYRISKPSQKWIESFNNKNIIQEYRVEGKFVDGFDPTTNTIYEFYGDYWHGNPAIFDPNMFNQRTKCTMQKLYDNTIMRATLLKSKGYNLIEIWENDWKTAH